MKKRKILEQEELFISKFTNLKKREILKEEKLFIKEFTNEFFEKYMKSESGLQEIVQQCADEVLKLQKKGKENIWHCILEVAVAKSFKEGLESYFRFDEESEGDPGLKKIISDFYKEPLFLELDVAQEIIYNLYRLEEDDEYNIENDRDLKIWEEEYRVLLEFGREMSKKDFSTDLIPGICSNRLEEKYDEVVHSSNVIFPKMINGNKITLESNFSELNLLYIGNETFQDYLCHSKKHKNYFKKLMEYVKILNEGENETLQYVWEKLTNFNSINIIAKFLTEVFERGSILYSENMLKNIVSEYKKVFQMMINMPNVLTRLLIFKQIFCYILEVTQGLGATGKQFYKSISSYIHEVPKGCWDYLAEVNELLPKLNIVYKCKKEEILRLLVLIRWKIGREKGKLDINEWIEELKMEYRIKNFERLFLFMNLDDGWYNKRLIDTVEIRNLEKGKRASYKMQDQKIDNSIFEFYKYIRKLNLLERIMDFNHNECKIGLSKKLQEEGWFHITSKAFEEFLCRGLDNTCELIGKHRVCTATCQKSENDKKEFEETTENIEKILNSCLLSEYNHVIFENTFIEKKTYIEVFNLLLYYIY